MREDPIELVLPERDYAAPCGVLMAVALDTNVISALAKPDCDERVLRWARQFSSDELLLPAPCWAELRRGVELLPAGRRRDALSARLTSMVDALGAVLPFGRAEGGRVWRVDG
ncbi:MAG: hypothetical protein IPJ61_03950 [Tessaracoccus sp.]|uniref:hypothetical protein n=1 Tax=Tessaracoccus sp. TaxID=1971211 RepID=UPI001ED440D3|nr:hypothetical protein [Tessaracoccus sp.]MBK7820233.1 hypothetical protein [Tessaracoccus sp.]